MLSNAYFLAKFRFDTVENEPAKNLQNFAKFANFADPKTLNPGSDLRVALQARGPGPPERARVEAGPEADDVVGAAGADAREEGVLQHLHRDVPNLSRAADFRKFQTERP